MLRSGVTGYDHLYNADEEVWLADISTNGAYRVTQHYFDGLGRETNTVVCIGHVPGEAAVPSQVSQLSQVSQSTTAYPYGGSDYAIHTDARGAVTITRTDIFGNCIESGEEVFTNGVRVTSTTTRSVFGGGSSTRREWMTPNPTGGTRSCASAEIRFDDYAADGQRVAYVVTESSDCGIVTNSVTVYDLLGRAVSVGAHGANGSVVTTEHTYDGTTNRKVSTATTGEPVITYAYNELGELVLTMQDGKSVGSFTSYETIGGEVYRVVTNFRMTGSVTNSVQRQMQRLTGLSDALRSRTISVSASGYETITESSYDAATELLTTVTRKGYNTPVTMVSRYGLEVEQTTKDGSSETRYDSLGRRSCIISMLPTTDATNRIDRMEYDISENVVRTTSDFLDGRIAVSTAEYDQLNRSVAKADPLGLVKTAEYDPLDRTVFTGGDAYLLRFCYDTLYTLYGVLRIVPLYDTLTLST